MYRDRGAPLERPTYYCRTDDDQLLPEAHQIHRVKLGGLLSLVWGTLWCRRRAPAPAASPVPWDPAELHPWVVELHGCWPNSYGGEEPRMGVAFSMPCPVDPREPSPEADAAILAVIARAMLHEGQEGTLIDGRRRDPHEFGEIGLEGVMSALASTCSVE